MGRALKPLSSYPMQLRQLALAAKAKPAIFPVRIAFPNATKAMDFRVLFYTYRRSLRSHLSSLTKEPDGATLLESDGAEAIYSPRISSVPDAPNGQTYCIFALTADKESNRTGLTSLADLLSDVEMPVFQPEEPQAVERPVQAKPKAEPKHRPYIDPSEDSVTGEYKNQIFSIPRSHIPDDAKDFDDSAIRAMFVHGLLELPLPTADYLR